MALLALTLLSACGESSTSTPPAKSQGSVFDGYVETRNVAQDTALDVQKSMQQQEDQIRKLQQP